MSRSKLYFASFSFLVLFFFTACGYLWDTPSSSLKRESIDFGLVITNEHKYDSRIWWFDSKLQAMQEQKLSYAALGSSFCSPAENRDELYLIPVGLGNQKDTKKVISVNKKTLQITEYPSQHINLIDTASIGEKVYSISNLNGISYLEALDKKEGTSKTVELPGSFFHCIFPVEENSLPLIKTWMEMTRKKMFIPCAFILRISDCSTKRISLPLVLFQEWLWMMGETYMLR
ncbi:hypothetical protein [Kallipyga massiliensis]|uniref:hypothetical protein n=1 Tax=Kallipyga massiliensis TaxID=1472764 RepID=UPI0026ECAC6A|nr:hypothetical protein [Kallipyga massiliensis]